MVELYMRQRLDVNRKGACLVVVVVVVPVVLVLVVIATA